MKTVRKICVRDYFEELVNLKTPKICQGLGSRLCGYPDNTQLGPTTARWESFGPKLHTN